jgi:hypothetical protein
MNKTVIIALALWPLVAAGQIGADASYVYVCTATNTWKRAPISTW